MAPGGHVVTASTADSNFTSSSATKSITVVKEDARVAYSGPASLSISAGPVVLTATVRDITAVPADPASDPYAGDIRNAQVQFIDRTTNTVLGTVNVVVGTDPMVGTASFTWSGVTANTYTIGFVVTNYYNRNQPADNVMVRVTN
jgi:hypothetical protein